MNFMNLACTSPFLLSPLHLDRTNCSTPWLTTRRRLCPICKRDIIVEESNVEEGGELGERSPLLNYRDADWRGDTAGGNV
jgi:hypothetical protein